MIWLLYNVCFAVGYAFMLPRFFYRMARRGGYARDFGQRLGWYRPAVRALLAGGGRVWVHAVSVGEVYVALALIEDWRRRRPGTRFVLSTNTSTAYAIARGAVAEPDACIYVPIDFPIVVRRALALIRPAALVLVELELWPNLLRLARARGVPVVLVNGRVSARSCRGYRLLGLLSPRLLPLPDLLCVQSASDAARFRALGAPEQRLHVLGSAKYDVARGDCGGEAAARAILTQAGLAPARRIVLGGSTWPGEEAALLDALCALRGQFPDLALVLAPRHVDRAEAVLAEARSRGLTAVRRTGSGGAANPDVLLLDTTGELRRLYACADAIFIGRSLTRRGGQNIIEPALSGKPIVVGPYTENFHAVVEDFRRAGALIEVRDAGGLTAALRGLLADPGRRAELGGRAARVVGERAGALRRSLDLIEPLLPGSRTTRRDDARAE
jgi:3-deoxy-D-manno-octulosonic-acid transferase